MRVRPIRAGGANVMCAALAFGPVLTPAARAQDTSAAQVPGFPASQGIATGQSASTTPVQDNATVPTSVNPAERPPEIAPQASDTTIERTLSNLREGSSPQQGVPVPTSRGRIQRNVYVGLGAAATYDDNATRSNSERATQRGLRQQDFVFPLAATVNLVVPSGANTYTLQGQVGYNFYLRNTRLNSENIALSGGYRRSFRGCDAGLNGGFARSRTQFEDTTLELDKNLQTTGTIGTSLSCNVTFGLRPFGSFDYLRARNSTGLRSYSDHDTKTFGGGIVNDFPTIGELGIVASIDDTDYPNRSSMLGGARHLRVKSLGVSFNRAAARILQVRFRLNYTLVKQDTTVSGSFKGVSGNAVVRFMPGGRFTFTATADRAATPSLSINSDYDLDTTFSLEAVARISGRTNARISYFNQHRKYFGVVALPGQNLTSDMNVSYNAGLSYQLRPKIALTAGVTHQRRTANNPIFDYSATRGTVGVNVRL